MNPLFQGTIYFVQVKFNVVPENKTFSVSASDMNTVVNYATKAAVPVSLYATQFGENAVLVSSAVITYSLNLNSRSMSDDQLRGLVKDVSSNVSKPACVAVMLPPEIDNSRESRTNGVGGYHDSVDGIFYINSYINNDQQGSTSLTVQDVTFRYAGSLSHEMAEMAVDPHGGNPEVCDPCGPNFVSTYLNYFDSAGNYITTSQTPPYDVTFPFEFYINGIVQPAYAKPQAAPASACSYGPVPTGQVALTQIPGAVRCDGFFTADDNFRHVVVGSQDGEIREVFYSPRSGVSVAPLTTVPGLVDIAGFYTPDDKYRHVLALTTDGQIHEIFYHPGQGQSVIGSILGATHVCGFYTDDDNYRHAIVAARDGSISEIFYHPQHGKGQTQIGSLQNIVDVGCFYSPDDHYRHALVATADGNITEIYYSPQHGVSQTVVTNLSGVKAVTAFYVPTDLFSRRIQAVDSLGTVHEFRYHPTYGVMKVKLVQVASVLDLGGFYSADDKARHAVVLDATSQLQEEFYFI